MDDSEYVDFGSCFKYFDEDGLKEHTVNRQKIFEKIKVNSTNNNFYYSRYRYFSTTILHGNYELYFYRDTYIELNLVGLNMG